MEYRNVKITKTELGVLNNGFLTAWVFFEGGGIGGSFGGLEIKSGPSWINEVLKCAGADIWENLPGRYIRVRFERLTLPITNIVHIIDDRISCDLNTFISDDEVEDI